MFDEFSVLKKIFETVETLNANHPDLLVVPGDDAAVLSSLKRPVVSTDTQRENVHFRLDWQSPFEIGYKAVAVSLSDLAASYAKPVCIFINLGLPSTCNPELVEELYKGIGTAVSEYPCAVGGGNISVSPVLSLDMFVMGEAYGPLFPKRSSACTGDGVYVTGPLGLAKAGLMCLSDNFTEFPELIDSFKKPEARFDAASVLCSNDVMCVMDVSDGLAGDAAHIAKASALTISIKIDDSDIPEELIRFGKFSGNSPLEMMISGGEDYELLFTCSPDVFNRIKKELPEAFQVGTCIPYKGFLLEGVPDKCRSFVHGR